MTTSQRGNAWEIWRRVLPVGLVLAAVVTTFVVTREPLARVEVMEFAQKQQDLGQGRRGAPRQCRLHARLGPA